MTRTGKIARLPRAIREQLNRRIDENQSGVAILDWLNALPEVQTLLAAEFDGCPISPANLTAWKNGGFCDWLNRFDMLEFARALEDEEVPGDDALSGPFADKLARWLAIQYGAAAFRALHEEDADPQSHWRRLRRLCADVARLQAREHQAQRISLERNRLELRASKAERRNKKTPDTAGLSSSVSPQPDATPFESPLSPTPDNAAPPRSF